VSKEQPKAKYSNKENDGSKSDRSYSDNSQKTKTHNSKIYKNQVLSDEKRALFSDERNKTQESVPKGILELRKQMLNQEYQALEEQKENDGVESSSRTEKDYKKSEYDTPREIGEEYSNRYTAHEFYVNDRS
jgi:hypothetical protein